MKLLLMPKVASWWVWLVTASLLAIGLAWQAGCFLAAIALSAGQAIWFWWKLRSPAPYAVQIRIAFTALLVLCFAPFLRWLYWLPCLGTFALVCFGYCLMGRMLSLMPWNRTEAISISLICRTLFTPPTLGNPAHGLPAGGCPGGICELEARIGQRPG